MEKQKRKGNEPGPRCGNHTGKPGGERGRSRIGRRRQTEPNQRGGKGGQKAKRGRQRKDARKEE